MRPRSRYRLRALRRGRLRARHPAGTCPPPTRLGACGSMGSTAQSLGLDEGPAVSAVRYVQVRSSLQSEPSAGTLDGVRFTAATSKRASGRWPRCLEVEVASQARTVEGALADLREGLERYFEESGLSVEEFIDLL